MNYDTDKPPMEMPPDPDEKEPEPATRLVVGVLMFILGLVIITAATFQFDLVKNHVFYAHPEAAPYVAAIGYICAISGLIIALIYFIKEG